MANVPVDWTFHHACTSAWQGDSHKVNAETRQSGRASIELELE